MDTDQKASGRNWMDLKPTNEKATNHCPVECPVGSTVNTSFLSKEALSAVVCYSLRENIPLSS